MLTRRCIAARTDSKPTSRSNPETGIITDCALTKASGPDTHDAAVAAQLLTGETMSVTVLADSAYGSGDFRAHLADSGHVDRVKSAPLRPACRRWFHHRRLHCRSPRRDGDVPGCGDPPDQLGRQRHLRGGVPRLRATAQCTTSGSGRNLRLRPHDALQRAARRESRDPNWRKEYRTHRPMVERTIAWLSRHNRKVRYRGVTKNDHWLHHRAAALNLRRLITLGLTHTGATWAIA